MTASKIPPCPPEMASCVGCLNFFKWTIFFEEKYLRTYSMTLPEKVNFDNK